MCPVGRGGECNDRLRGWLLLKGEPLTAALLKENESGPGYASGPQRVGLFFKQLCVVKGNLVAKKKRKARALEESVE